MKKLSFLLVTVMLATFVFCGCDHQKTEYQIGFLRIDHAVVEPDEKAALSEEELHEYQKLVDAVIERKENFSFLCDSETAQFYKELLRENPYGFLLSDIAVGDNAFSLSYAYGKEEQDEIISFMDTTILSLLNQNYSEDDNKLDRILKLYYAVTGFLSYDHTTSDITPLSDSHLRYPDDSVYLALKTRITKCYGFSYLFDFLMLQNGYDCFAVYGVCHSRGDSHMWYLFEYDGEYFFCDPTWDRSEGGYSKLMHFGKTTDERTAESVEGVDFVLYHTEGYPAPVCTDRRFSIFRGISHFSCTEKHRFYMKDFDDNEYIFDTESFTMETI